MQTNILETDIQILGDTLYLEIFLYPSMHNLKFPQPDIGKIVSNSI